MSDGGIDDKDQQDGMADATKEVHDADSPLQKSSPQVPLPTVP